jgi:hypothetical protein
MEHRVPGVLPALVDEAAVTAPAILDETVAVGVAVLVDPDDRGLDVRPDRIQRVSIGGVLPVEPGERDEQRRRIDRPVVTRERHLS